MRNANPSPRPPLQVALLVTAAACGTTGAAVELPCDDPDLGHLRWLAGSWVCEDDEGAVTEEHWTEPRGRMMFGVQRVVKSGNTTSFEYLRIERRDDGIVYVASPFGRQPTTFRLVESRDGLARFANPQHDFPQVVQYRRDGARLCARIEGDLRGESRSAEWVMQRARLPSARD